MRTLKSIAVTTLATLAISIGALATAPSASAMTKEQCWDLVRHYTVNAMIFESVGSTHWGWYWRGKASGLADACSREWIHTKYPRP